MIYEVVIIADEQRSAQEKGSFFEDLLRSIMETQRYDVTERIRFTGTEIDLLCTHKDRPNDTAVVECKARQELSANDLKQFACDVVVDGKARMGYFVHTAELRGEAAGKAREWRDKGMDQLVVIGPGKLIELLQDAQRIGPPPTDYELTITKQLLLYSYLGVFWVTLLARGTVATHYAVAPASRSAVQVPDEATDLAAGLGEVASLERLDATAPAPVGAGQVSLDAVAEIQECDQWDDYRPVGARYFVGRTQIQRELYQFVRAPITGQSDRRVFFVEGHSGRGKSSLIANLRARARFRRNKNVFYVLAVDSRSADTSDFVALAVAKLCEKAFDSGFIPRSLAPPTISSPLDVMGSPSWDPILQWLADSKRVLVLVFDQFEDVFRKVGLFRAFHKAMCDVHNRRGPVVLGFSWKSDISIPMNNPAYALWQQAREWAQTFEVGEFYEHEIDGVIRQLGERSGHSVPWDLKRRLKENSQGFPWLIKKLCIHCYRQVQSGATFDELVDRDLNVEVLFREDEQNLGPEEARALRLIAQRGSAGEPLDVSEIGDDVTDEVIYSLQAQRMIVRSGAKYNVYWDVFRDYLVEGEPPRIGESFIVRQYPTTCIDTFEAVLASAPCSIGAVRDCLQEQRAISLKSVDNRLRELRHLGVVTKTADLYHLRKDVRSVDDLMAHMRRRLDSHIVVRALRASLAEVIGARQVIAALRQCYPGFRFQDKTWQMYGNYLISWLRRVGIDLGRRLGDTTSRTLSADSFIPQWRPDKDIELLLSLRGCGDPIDRPQGKDKGLYDLKAFGYLTYEGPRVHLTRTGAQVLQQDDRVVRQHLAASALQTRKVRLALQALIWEATGNGTFEEGLQLELVTIPSESYRKVCASVLKSWARFARNVLESVQAAATGAQQPEGE